MRGGTNLEERKAAKMTSIEAPHPRTLCPGQRWQHCLPSVCNLRMLAHMQATNTLTIDGTSRLAARSNIRVDVRFYHTIQKITAHPQLSNSSNPSWPHTWLNSNQSPTSTPRAWMREFTHSKDKFFRHSLIPNSCPLRLIMKVISLERAPMLTSLLKNISSAKTPCQRPC